MKKKKITGIWLFGLSGSGKTYISRKIGEKIKKNTVIVDGDKVRSYISTDLGYSKKERKTMKSARKVLWSALTGILE